MQPSERGREKCAPMFGKDHAQDKNIERDDASEENHPASTRELTLDEAVSLAILLQKNEQFAAAHEGYSRGLETAPDHPRALHQGGALAHQQGRNEEALALSGRSLALLPDQADWYTTRGIVLQSGDRLDPAIASSRRAIALDPSHSNAHNNLGV